MTISLKVEPIVLGRLCSYDAAKISSINVFPVGTVPIQTYSRVSV